MRVQHTTRTLSLEALGGSLTDFCLHLTVLCRSPSKCQLEDPAAELPSLQRSPCLRCAAMQSPSPASSESFIDRVRPEDPEVAAPRSDRRCGDVELGLVPDGHITTDTSSLQSSQAVAQGINRV